MKKFMREMEYIVFLVPAFIVYTVLCIVPLAQTLWLSFTDWDGLSMDNLSFVGIENFIGIFSNPQILTAFQNTIVYTVFTPIIITVIAIPLAVALNSPMKTRNIQRAIFYFPSVVSVIILGYLWSYMYSPTSSGIINAFIVRIGFEPIYWLSDYTLAMVSVIIVAVWGGVGWHTCIYLARLQSIPTEYYEAAKVDGASKFRMFRFITLPMLTPAMTVSFLFLLLASLKVFDLPFALTSGGPGVATTMMSQMIMLKGFTERQYGQAAAMSVVFFLMISVVAIIQLVMMKKRESDNS